ncbi:MULTISPECIES: capsular polysaccharide export protein, LipB/KpsS family [Paraburkholderia]|uniref:Capsular biosynthesis protein n=1 Tax=Paraburkholderia podalyriae TaxID=1938811 RepID=A0ABR7PYT2_9BURK|nr:capsular biosynthesis protein [Paraburkholderia podalyriae]MBC8751455.1 capsular biosynthesis protein [Paraburkholderia podalyriae]
MKERVIAGAEASRNLAIDLRSLTRGWRLWSGLRQRNLEQVWIDRWHGRIALRVARLLRKQINAAWPGPVWSHGPAGTPLLSWFSMPLANASAETFAAVLNEALAAAMEQDRSSQVALDSQRLMQRLAHSHALAIRDTQCRCPVTLLEPRSSERVLLIDERARSKASGATATRHSPTAFARMLQAATSAHPQAEFWIAQSNDPGRGRWLSASLELTLPAGTRRFAEHESVCAALPHVDHVYTLGASEGMQALLAGARVHVFGAPYYAGWGLTHDDQPLPNRTARPTLAALFDVVFVRSTRYLNPATHAPGALDDLLDSIELQHTVQQRFTDLQNVAALRFQWWKRPFATPYITAGKSALRWTAEPQSVESHETAVLWGARSAEGLAPEVRRVRIEDGFFHSTGLGSDMIAPRSQVIDRRGLYFDASQPSDLSVLLNETEFSETELARAAALRNKVVQLGVTKYNLGRQRPAWTAPAGKQIVLVPGQVADDASIRLGTRAIGTADALLREVRRLRPDAFVIYKPHPDVLSGNRNGLIDAQQLADVVDTEADLLSLVDAAHEVHTLSSLAGFDALLRGKAVFTYGLPFYAGWGLTHDALAPLPWRHRTLTLDMLCAGVLLRYPLYFDWKTRLFTTPEAVVEQLAPQAARPLEKVRGNRMRPLLKAFRWTRNAIHHTAWRFQQKRAARLL